MRKQFIVGAVLTAVMLVGVSALQAKKPSGGSSGSHGGQMSKSSRSGPGSSRSSRNYLSSHGHKFSHGYFYKSRDHFHWSYQCYWNRYGCYCYWCPYADCWYYYCQPRGCYYPVSYAEFARPTTNVNVNVANSASSNGNVIGSPGLPVVPDGAGPVQNFNKNSIR